MLDDRALDRLELAAGQKVREQEYWLDKLADSPAKSCFPYDYAGRGKARPQMRSQEFAIEDRTGERLLKMSSQSDLRLHMILLTGVTALLHKYSHDYDIMVGMPIYKEDTDMAFINTVLILRIELGQNMTFRELLLQVRQTVTEAVDHQDYPLEILLRHLGLQAAGDDFPFFDVAVLLENIHHKKYLGHVHANVIFSFRRTDGKIVGLVEYNSLCYHRATIERIVGHLNNLLSRAVDEVDRPLGAVEILSEAEKRRLLQDFNDAAPRREPCLPPLPLNRLFERQVERTADGIAVGTPAQDFVSYGELNRQANRLAHLLMGKGVKPGVVAAVIMDPSVHVIAAILAVLKAGGAYLPIDPAYPEERVLAILKDSDASFILTTSGVQNRYTYTDLRGFRLLEIEPQVSPLRPQADFDRLPLPDRSLIDFEKYGQYIGHAMVRNAVSMQGSRGCPYNCAFCHRTMMKKNVPRSAENIFEEVKFYYDHGVRRFSFVDEIFNLHAENSARFFQLVIKNRLDVQLFFPNGMRADRLTESYIDLMVEAGTVNLGLALETASPRLQKLIRKNLDIDKLRRNGEYFCRRYPGVILELFTMHGFPTETEEEAMQTLDFVKSLKWVHFPYVFLLKIHPSTDMMELALANGVSREAIYRSMTAAFHEIPETLPFPKQFTRMYVAQFLNDYFLLKERLLHVLPYQLKVATRDELVRKYDNYLPAKIRNFSDLLSEVGIGEGESADLSGSLRDSDFVPDYAALRERRSSHGQEKDDDALRILLLDLSVLFSAEERDILHGEITEPLGLIYLLTYLNERFGPRVTGRVAKSKIDFDSMAELKALVHDFRPDLIGIRTLSYFKDFFHRVVSAIRGWGIDAPIIAGGPYGTSDYRLVLQDPQVALTVLREGELTLAELVEAMLENDKRLPGESRLEKIEGIAFIRSSDRQQLKRSRRQVILLDQIPEGVNRFPGGNPEAVGRVSDLLYLISTSGSTGTPRSVMLEHRNLLNLLQYQYAATNIDFSRVLQFASIGFDVSAQEIFSTLLAGGSLFLLDRELKLDIPRLFSYIRQRAIGTLFLPPAFLKYVFDEPVHARLFPPSVRHIVAAGEQLVVSEKFGRYLKDHGVYVHNHYGPSETHVVSALTIDPQEEIAELPAIGRPIFNTGLYVLDAQRKPVPLGVSGELYIAGDSVGRGYCNREELSAERYMADPFFAGRRMYRSGDLARWNMDGSLQFLGRVDFQVKIRGFRVELAEIESQLSRHEAVKEAVVIAGEKPNGEKYLCAYIVFLPTSPTNGTNRTNRTNKTNRTSETNPFQFREYLSRTLPDYMIPDYFVRVDRLPLTASGKLNRKALPQPRLDDEAAADFVSPRSETEKRLAAIWADLLEIDGSVIGIDANFFALGGHSLKATVMIVKIQQEFRVRVPLTQVFTLPTIRGLADYLEKAERESVSLEGGRLLPLKKGSGTGNLFLVHDGTGEVEGYIEFCRHLELPFHCWGIKAEGLIDYTPRNVTIEALAGDYVAMIGNVQPHGPYYIAGWSLGGNIAFEMVRQLEHRSEEILFLGLIDSMGPRQEPDGEIVPFSLESELSYIGNYLGEDAVKGKFEEVSGLGEIWPAVVDVLEQRNFDVEVLKESIAEYGMQVLPRYHRLGIGESIFYLNMGRTLNKALFLYVPGGTVHTPVHYFKASRSPTELLAHWRDYCAQPIHSHEIDADHFSIMKPPAVRETAATFTQALLKHQ